LLCCDEYRETQLFLRAKFEKINGSLDRLLGSVKCRSSCQYISIKLVRSSLHWASEDSSFDCELHLLHSRFMKSLIPQEFERFYRTQCIWTLQIKIRWYFLYFAFNWHFINLDPTFLSNCFFRLVSKQCKQKLLKIFASNAIIWNINIEKWIYIVFCLFFFFDNFFNEFFVFIRWIHCLKWMIDLDCH
jgi:hypothetical protein